MTERIGFDLDGVLSNFNRIILQTIKEMFGLSYTEDQITDWYYYNCLPGFTEEMFDKLFERLVKKKDIWKNAKPYDDKTMRMVADLSWKTNLYFITSRFPNRTHEDTLMQTREWIKAHNIDAAGVVLTREKAAACKLLGLDLFLDDNAENVKEIAENSETHCFLLDRPYNQGYKTDHRVMSVKEFLGWCSDHNGHGYTREIE